MTRAPALAATGDAPLRHGTRRLLLRRSEGCAAQIADWRVRLVHRPASSGGRSLRGLGVAGGVLALAGASWLALDPLSAAGATGFEAGTRDEFQAQVILPLARGGESGRRMGATAAVVPLAAVPERPAIEIVATLTQGGDFAQMLQRAGVGASDRERAAHLLSQAIDLSEVEPGTPVTIRLGRRASRNEPRPLQMLGLRARLDLALEIDRRGGTLALSRKPIRVDETPLRITGVVGHSLYRSARAAGAPAAAVQAYLRALSAEIDLDRDLRPDDRFDMILAHRRAATGERQAGRLLYAGIERNGTPVTQLMRWGRDGEFFEASGAGEQRSGLLAPVPGRISSHYGMRRHPILGFRRMHGGMDFKASYGTPIVAVTDGHVTAAGRMGGCGIAVRLDHGDDLGTRYCHMSRMAVRPGQQVQRGQVIGYVGSTGLSTGPHLHYEMYRAGRTVNPASVEFVTRARLSGEELRRFRETLARLQTVKPGAALARLPATRLARLAPRREIDRAGGPLAKR